MSNGLSLVRALRHVTEFVRENHLLSEIRSVVSTGNEKRPLPRDMSIQQDKCAEKK
jgi:hypothetical protein